VKRQGDPLARAFTLASWCRFSTTARRTSHQASVVRGGNADLLGSWQQCRDARSRPADTAARTSAELRQALAEGDTGEAALVAEAVDACCADVRCLTRVFQGAHQGLAPAAWQLVNHRFSPAKRAR